MFILIEQIPLPEYEETDEFEIYEPTQEELDWLAAQDQNHSSYIIDFEHEPSLTY